MSEDLASALVREGLSVYLPESRPFPHEADEHYLGVSTIVKKSAEEYAQRIIERVVDEPTEDGRYWGWLGNNLCDAGLRPLTPHREIRVEAPIADWDGWRWVGHMDGVSMRKEGVVVHEAKAYTNHDNDSKNEAAFRQAALYLALLTSRMRSGDTHFGLAEFQEDKTARPLVLKPLDAPNTAPWGVCLHISSRMGPPPAIIARSVTQAELDGILQFYTEKALAIKAAVEAGDATVARELWDRAEGGLLEGLSDLTEALDPPDEASLEAYAEAKEAASGREKASKVEKDDAQAKALAIMARLGRDRVETERFFLTAVGGFDGARRPWLRVTEKRE